MRTTFAVMCNTMMCNMYMCCMLRGMCAKTANVVLS